LNGWYSCGVAIKLAKQAKSTALFGMTRTGKSNAVKKVIQATVGMTENAPYKLEQSVEDSADETLEPFTEDGVPKYPIGQIIFDINGEYANPNMQDEGTAIFEMFQEQTTRFRSSGSTRGVVFFLGGGFLELSGSSRTAASESVGVWLQVRDVDAVGRELEEAGVEIIELPTEKPWGLREMQVRDPDGLSIVIVEVPETHPLRRR
jgi:uncharacterized glyoxalase superfamily protein PhnB